MSTEAAQDITAQAEAQSEAQEAEHPTQPNQTKEQAQPPAQTKFHYWDNPPPTAAGKSVEHFLELLPGPTHIHLSGQQPGPCRAAVTLMHGNEPSGLHGVFGLIKEGLRPLQDMEIFIPCVDAARHEPGFVYRTLPQQKDINRCFADAAQRDGLFGHEKTQATAQTYTELLSERDLLAGELLLQLARLRPECCLDIHNTSGASPAFGVATFKDARHEALVSLFTRRLVITGIKLGALMELSSKTMPIVTIECGGAAETASHERALVGLRRYFTEPDILPNSAPDSTQPDLGMELFHQPMRLELAAESDISFGSQPLLTEGVTLLPDVERFNFGPISPDDQLGFVRGPLEASLSIKDYHGAERVQDFFCLQGEALYPRRSLKLFMVTTNPDIARRDCLFYIVEP